MKECLMVYRNWILAVACASVVTLLAICPSVQTPLESYPATNLPTLTLLPFGPKQLPSNLFGASPFTGAYVNAGSPGTLMKRLRLARAGRIHLIVKLAGPRRLFQNQDGAFSLEMWKRNIDRLRAVNLASSVADGTVIGAELVNEPHVRGKWGGRIITKAQLEAAAAYAKSIWPYLPVGAGRSDYLLKYAPWKHLDFGHSQYHMRKGDIDNWRLKTVQESKAAGTALLLSLNFYGGEVGNNPMTPQEVQRMGSVLAADTYACGLTGYVYDEEYYAVPGMEKAFAVVASAAAKHPAPPCYVGSVKP